ncbi:MAG: hypothetical protein R3Y13_06005 [bacterium]
MTNSNDSLEVKYNVEYKYNVENVISKEYKRKIISSKFINVINILEKLALNDV